MTSVQPDRPPATRGGRPPRLARPLVVESTAWVSPHLRRLWFGGSGVDHLARSYAGWTDSYVKLVFAPRIAGQDASTATPVDLDAARRDWPADEQPVLRTYTLRELDPERARVAIDLVVHGDEGVAGPWAARAEVGDVVHALGPGGAYAPDVDAPWHLMVGDESALPAVLASLAAVPAGREAHVFLEVDGPDDEVEVETAADLRLTWLHRDGAPAGTSTLIPEAVEAFVWPDGATDCRGHLFVHGEAETVKRVRRHLLRERGVPRERLSVSGYWRRGDSEEGFRRWKQAETQVPESQVPESQGAESQRASDASTAVGLR